MTRVAWCLVLAFAIFAAAAAAQQRPTIGGGGTARPGAPPPGAGPAAAGTARVRGRVVRAESGTPLAESLISIASLSGNQVFFRSVAAGEDGRFELADLPADQYEVRASHGGYVTQIWGQRDGLAGRSITLAEGEVLEDVDFPLQRGGVITGRITDEFGDPVSGVQVSVERYVYGPTGRQLTTFALSTNTLGFPTTNDLGEYRIFGLVPGEYVVSGRVPARTLTMGGSGRSDFAEGFVPTYFPGTPSAAVAQAIRVGPAQETAAHFAMIPGRMVQVSGTVADSRGRPAAGLRLSLTTATATSRSSAGAGTVTAGGSFSISNVPPGEYVLEVRPAGGASAGAEGASVPLAIGTDDVTGLRIVTSAGTTIAGRVEWEGTAPRRAAGSTSAPRITVTPIDGRPQILGAIVGATSAGTGAIGEDDTFEIGGVAGRVSLAVNGLGSAWTIKAVFVDGRDVTDTGVDTSTLGGNARVRIVLTDRLTEVAGTVRDSRGRTVHDYVVVVVPQEIVDGATGARFTRTLRPDQSGSFRLRALPPGRYVAAALASADPGSEWDPAVQASIRSTGRPFALSEGQSITVSLELQP